MKRIRKHRQLRYPEGVDLPCSYPGCDKTYHLDYPTQGGGRNRCDEHRVIKKREGTSKEWIKNGYAPCNADEEIKKRTGCLSPKQPIELFYVHPETKKVRSICNPCGVEIKWTRETCVEMGFTPDEYYEQLEKQNYVCDICKRPNKNKNKLSVDHDHVTGILRGLLCSECNLALPDRAKDGHDEIQILLNMVRYLQMADLANKGLIKDFVFSNRPNEDMDDYEGFLSED